MNKITLSVVLFISALTVVAIGFYARDLFMEYGKVLKETALSTTTTVYVGDMLEYKPPLFHTREDVQIHFTFDQDVSEWTEDMKKGYIFGRVMSQIGRSTTHYAYIKDHCIILSKKIFEKMYCSPQDIDIETDCSDRPDCFIEVKYNVVPKLSVASWLDYHLPEAPDYSKNYDTCASRDYPRGTRLMVATQAGKSVVCRVNDYGPEEWTGVQLDLSSHAFAQLAPLSQGLVEVTIEEV